MVDFSFYADGVDMSEVKVSTGTPDPIPANIYTLQPESFEEALTKDGTGQMLKAMFSVVTGPFEGRKIFAQYNLKNKSAMAQTIAWGDVMALCLACGVDFEAVRQRGGGGSDLLLYKPFDAKVVIENKPPYEPRNKISKYIPHGNAGSTMAAPVAVKPAFIPAGVAGAVAKPSGGLPWGKQDGVPV
jgi:hypothetical protein